MLRIHKVDFIFYSAWFESSEWANIVISKVFGELTEQDPRAAFL